MPRRRPVSDLDRLLAREYVQDEMSIDQLHHRYAMHRSTVTRALKRAGVTIRPPGRNNHVTPARLKQIELLVRGRVPRKEVAAELGLGRSTVNYYVRQLGLQYANGRPASRSSTGLPREQTLRRRCPVDGCYDITTNPVCRNGHAIYTPAEV